MYPIYIVLGALIVVIGLGLIIVEPVPITPVPSRFKTVIQPDGSYASVRLSAEELNVPNTRQVGWWVTGLGVFLIGIAIIYADSARIELERKLKEDEEEQRRQRAQVSHAEPVPITPPERSTAPNPPVQSVSPEPTPAPSPSLQAGTPKSAPASDPPTQAVKTDPVDEPSRAQNLADLGTILAYLGIVLWPLAFIGAACGAAAKAKTKGKSGRHAVVAGMIIGVLGMFFVGSLIVESFLKR